MDFLKGFWKQALLVILGIILGIGGVFAFEYFSNRDILSLTAISRNFQQAENSILPSDSEIINQTSLPAEETPNVFQTPEPSTTIEISPYPSPSPKLKKLVSIDVDNTGAGMYQFEVTRGTEVELTLNVMDINVDPSGLEFKSEVINTGQILPNSSKTITFIAQESFTLVPYSALTDNPKPYTIKVIVR
jgi:hypothetical protein